MGQSIQTLCKKSKLKATDFKKVKAKDINDISAVIDFSSPESFIACVNFCIENSIPSISGTTGLSGEHLEIVSTAKKFIPILLASNMSLGIANLKSSIDQYLSSISTPSKCKIIEIHHRHKKDSPSGTAIEIQSYLANLPGSKIDSQIDVQSLRIGDIFGIHRIIFENAEGVTTFQHIANSRIVFARGALQAAKWIHSKNPGEYSFADFLNKKL
jgi:4-hydroxy-tetrahydrodipicolinate reductase